MCKENLPYTRGCGAGGGTGGAPLLKRLFLNPKDAKLLWWHAEERKRDGTIRHVADSPQWRNIDSKFQEFGTYKRSKACPVCEDDTQSLWLSKCRKIVYMDHRIYLLHDHLYRKKKKVFNGKTEDRKARLPLRGATVFSRVENINITFGKIKCKNKGKHKRKGLLLNIKGKSKDGKLVREDMVEMGIRPELAPSENPGKRTYLPAACYTMSKDEKTRFCKCLHGVKFPSGYSSSIKKLVSMNELNFFGMKSHDCHVLMARMIPIAIHGILPDRIRHTVTKLCLFFNMIHSKVINPEVLESWQSDIILTLCQLEMYFPPSFFDVMVHLVSHIVNEIKCCGPVFERYMYPFERHMSIFKGYVRNRYRPEGSIVEGYVTELTKRQVQFLSFSG
ncbi:hypothetical protein LXL04_023460 [Taraxacum kok-saghyz]